MLAVIDFCATIGYQQPNGANKMITATTNNGQTYYTAVSRGTKYTVCPQTAGNFWVASCRLSLGNNFGGGKYYANIADIAKGCKAFAGLDMLVNL